MIKRDAWTNLTLPALPVGPVLAVGAALLLGALIGVVVAAAPSIGIVIGLGLVALAGLMLLARSGSVQTSFLGLLTGLLLGYALLGRGFAYIGLGSIFIGEIALVLAIIAMAPRIIHARLSGLQLLVVLFAILGLFRTVPYIGEHGIAALRDGVVWGYAAFAIALSLLLRAEHFPKIVSMYARAVPLVLIWVPIAGFLHRTYSSVLPTAPGADVPLLWFKGGDAAVHLAGVAAFVLVGLHVYAQQRAQAAGAKQPTLAAMPMLLVWALWGAGVVSAGAVNRGGLVAVTAVVSTVLVLWRSSRGLMFAGVIAMLVLLAGIANLEIETSGNRVISVEQIGRNLISVVQPEATPELEGTADWRLEWWGEIISYTIYGDHFWDGKGFGINLAEDDGFLGRESQLRSPHNGHMTILARMGVPGFGLWVVILTLFGAGLMRAFFRAMSRRDTFWAQVNLWIFAYWMAMLINMMFDVYLEGPQGGIWFWSVMGLGMAALAAQQNRDEDKQPKAQNEEREEAHEGMRP